MCIFTRSMQRWEVEEVAVVHNVKRRGFNSSGYRAPLPMGGSKCGAGGRGGRLPSSAWFQAVRALKVSGLSQR